MRCPLAVILAFIGILAATQAFASQPVGGMATALPEKVEFTVGYFNSHDKWDSRTFSGQLKFRANTYYGQLAYGMAPGWDVYLRGGASDARSEGDLHARVNMNLFGAAGFHGRLGIYRPWYLAFGPVGNIAFHENWAGNSTATVSGVPGTARVELNDHYSGSIGMGLQWRPLPEVTFFTGPFYFYEKARLKLTLSGDGRTFSENMNTKKSFGPRFGLNVKLRGRVNVSVEGQYRDYFSGGASVGANF